MYIIVNTSHFFFSCNAFFGSSQDFPNPWYSKSRSLFGISWFKTWTKSPPSADQATNQLHEERKIQHAVAIDIQFRH